MPAGHGPVFEDVPVLLVVASPGLRADVIGALAVVVVDGVEVVELGAVVAELGVLIVDEVVLAGTLDVAVVDADVVVEVVAGPVDRSVMPGEAWIPGDG